MTHKCSKISLDFKINSLFRESQIPSEYKNLLFAFIDNVKPAPKPERQKGNVFLPMFRRNYLVSITVVSRKRTDIYVINPFRTKGEGVTIYHALGLFFITQKVF